MSETDEISELGDFGVLAHILDALRVKDCEMVAERLLERFGSFDGVFSATDEEIGSLNLVTERVSSFFAFVRPMIRQALLRGVTEKLNSERAIIRYVTAFLLYRPSPALYAIFTKDRKPILAETLTAENIVREAVGKACRLKADGLILVRYRPSGELFGRSDGFLSTVKQIAETCALAEIDFIDYIEFAPYKFFSYNRHLNGDDNIIDVLDAK